MGLGFAAALAFSACDKNLEPKFDDKNAFVAFERVAYAVAEDYSEKGDTYKVPVTLASVAGLEATIKFEIGVPEKKPAVEGKNFELVTTTGTLSFDAEHRTRYVEFKTIPDGEYTGDLSFTITLTGTEEIAVGAEKTCTVTLNDIDHPLGFLFGSYTSKGEDYFDGPSTWTTTITKDDTDDHRIWFVNLANDGGREQFRTYGNVSDDLSTVNIPFGQEYTIGSYNVSLQGVTEDEDLLSSGSANGTITVENGKVTITFKEYGFGYIVGNSAFAIVMPGVTAVKN